MKNLLFLLIPFLVCFCACKSTKPAAGTKTEVAQAPVYTEKAEQKMVDFSDPTTWILGYFKAERLTKEPYSSWYIKGFDDYEFNSEAVNKLMDIPGDNLKIKIVMGTWCPDSRREVPRFMRIIDIWKFPLSQIQFIGVDHDKGSPIEEYPLLKIERVPTFIIYKNNIEAGRIIETPVTSLEQDMVNILTRNE
jgi:thiol-disulfide isomerase/thioredoxin